MRFRTIILSAALIAILMLMLMALRKAHAPWLVSPVNGTVQAQSDPVVFTWRYGGFLYSFPFSWRPAEHFVVCVKEAAPGDFPCTYPQGSESGVWADTVDNHPWVSGAPGTQYEEIIRHYSLTLDQLPAEFQGVDLMWTAAACASTDPDSCSWAVPAWRFLVGTLDLEATTAHVNYIGGSSVEFESVIQNLGPANSGPVTVKLQVAQLMLDGNNRAIDDLNAPGIDKMVDRVFLKDGRIMTIDALLTSGGSQSDVKGILVRNGFVADYRNTFNNGLNAGDYGYFNSPTVSIPQFTSQPSGSRVGLFLEVIVDPDKRIAETDETHQSNTKQDKYVYTVP